MNSVPLSDETRWWWIRHAPVTANNGRIYGQSDMPADCSDQDTFLRLAKALPQNGIWVTSHLMRTSQTMDAVLAARKAAASSDQLQATIEPGLAEQSFGDWQGKTYEELGREVQHRFWLAPAHVVPPGGESFVQLMGRVTEVVERLSQLHRGRDIIAFAHGGTIRAAVALALGLEPEQALSVAVENCSITRLDFFHAVGQGSDQQSWRVSHLNASPSLIASLSLS